MEPVADRVKKIIVDQLGVEEETVTPEASFVDDLGADSLDTVELVMALEEEFGIEIPDDTVVVIPHLKLWDQLIFNANDGRQNLLCAADFYLHPGHDAAQVPGPLEGDRLEDPPRRQASGRRRPAPGSGGGRT